MSWCIVDFIGLLISDPLLRGMMMRANKLEVVQTKDQEMLGFCGCGKKVCWETRGEVTVLDFQLLCSWELSGGD